MKLNVIVEEDSIKQLEEKIEEINKAMMVVRRLVDDMREINTKISLS